MPLPTVCATPVPVLNAAMKVESGGPENGLKRAEHTRGNNRGDRIGGVVKPVDEIERQSDQNDHCDQDERRVHPVNYS